MLFCVIFEDNAGQDHLRRQHMSEHLSFLTARGQQIEGAGPLFQDGSGHGGMWLVQAADAAEVQALVEAAPFWPTGLRKSVTILEWRQVFRYGQKT
jgi:hypothetical protein